MADLAHHEGVVLGDIAASVDALGLAGVSPSPEDGSDLIVLAYAAAMQSLDRHMRGDPGAQDLPIGAAARDVTTGKYYCGFARDNEVRDRDAHAEYNTLLQAIADGAELGNLVMGTTVEPCPGCLRHLADSGIRGIVFGAGRGDLEDLGLVKRHGKKIFDLIADGEARGGIYPDVVQIEDLALRAACVATFHNFRRDTQSERVTYEPPRYVRPLGFSLLHLASPELLSQNHGGASITEALRRGGEALRARFPILSPANLRPAS